MSEEIAFNLRGNEVEMGVWLTGTVLESGRFASLDLGGALGCRVVPIPLGEAGEGLFFTERAK